MMKNNIMLFILCVCISVFCGCGNKEIPDLRNETRDEVLDSLIEEIESANQEDDSFSEPKTVDDTSIDEETIVELEPDTVQEEEREIPSLGAWVSYWDMDTAQQELDAISESMDTVCHFAAYFDANHNPFIPQETVEYHMWQEENRKTQDMVTYLTFVNDIALEEGSSLKDTDLLYELFSSQESIVSHVSKILDMTVQGGYDGIEIDYEAIRKDIELWNLFIEFIEELMEQANARDVMVRVLLEPNVPIDELSFPAGPEYVMMCYNLYGYGTEPGPKADIDFLEEMVTIMEKLPGDINFALATGGFDFAEDESVAQVTMSEARRLQTERGSEPIRDSASSALYFDYVDEAGMTHQLWYADEETLQIWMNEIRGMGHNRFTIWRIGGNVELE